MPKNAIVLMFDSLQFNYVGAYGNDWIKTPNMDWRFYNDSWQVNDLTIYSVGAFIFKNEEEIKKQQTEGCLDAIIAIELDNISTIHILDSTKDRELLNCIHTIVANNRTIKIQIH